MSKDDSNSSGGGLLSKMVKFVRNPTVNWNELDSVEDSRETQYSKQMLKEMIERKRRNDFVRRREFDQLRKLRQREALQGQRTEDPTARPSFFQSSMASPDERAVTLKKIDEIEAQMSQQWWKSKSAADAPTQPAHLASSEESHARAFAPTAPLSLPGPLPPGQTIEPLFDHDSMSVSRFGTVSAPGIGRHIPDAPPPPRVVVPEPVAFVHDPDLEEASILFANGDAEGAEAGLLDVLAQHENDPPEQQIEIWMTLFDLYRAIDAHERFDALSLNFAGRFDRSAPLWFSMPELAGVAAQSVHAGLVPLRDFQWSAPPTLTAQTLAALTASLSRAAPPWTLTWSRLTAIEDNAVAPMADLFSHWAEDKLQLSFFGVEALNGVLEAHTQSGDRAARPEWWRLRMAMLRLMNRSDEFELVALDYCVTYEVSPPQWAPPLCSYTGDNGAPADAASAPDDGLAPSLYDSQPSMLGGDDAQPSASLAGHIEGDASALLEPFDELLPPGVPLVISCERLIRIDFAAAGSVLNWTAAQQAQGRVVHFAQMQRLVAVFFNVIGINEHAWVVPRKN